MAANKHTPIEELLEVVFSVWSMPRLYNEDQQPVSLRVASKQWQFVVGLEESPLQAAATSDDRITNRTLHMCCSSDL
jgi:hypothetical protein